MLVVVRSAEDAAVAIEGGADRLVVRLSAMGGEASALDAIGRVVAGQCPVTLCCPDGLPADLAAALDSCNADEVFGPSTPGLWPPLPASVRKGAMLPFGGSVTEGAFETAAANDIAGILFGEGVQPRRLLQVVTVGHLQQQVRWARARNLTIGFAGIMEVPDIPRLLAIAPDVLVFDDAVRQHGLPSGPINPERIRFVRELIPRAETDEILSGRAAAEVIGRDRIFVRDWVVSVHLGAYEHERMAQRVRFTIETEVARTATRAADIRDVVTYDLITDAISRATVDHVELVETVAEDVAAAILAHPRAMAVDVTIEKLDLGPGSLGCRIVRSRDRAA